ncbi:MAG TPA: response regulator [Nitriliruptorales bacterium]
MRILIAEDDEDIRALLEVTLLDHDVVSVGDGRAALPLIGSDRFEAAVLDVMMPEVDGLSVCRAIRRDERIRDIPIVMLTARVQEEDHIKGFEAGADRYLTKPFEPDDLTEILAELEAMPVQRRVADREERLRQARFLRQVEHRF